MPQGKMKVKTKVPAGIKTKTIKKIGKGTAAATKRQNRPAPRNKSKMVEVQKVKKAMSKNINMVVEEDLRQKALEGRQSLGRKRSAPASAPATSNDDGPSKKRKKN